jgi:mono/diheme cytochrome c family protein
VTISWLAGRKIIATLLLGLLPANCAQPTKSISQADGAHKSVVDVRSTPLAGKSGSAIFAANCAACHGATGAGGDSPSLEGERHRMNLAQAITWIEKPAPPMPKLYPIPLSRSDVEAVAKYVEKL